MKIYQTKYKDVDAICIENEKYALTVLPGEGAKIVSFKTRADGREFLWQNPAEIYGHIGLGDSYVDGECSSFDDMFPTIDPITLDYSSRASVEYSDHGEVCRLAFSCRQEESSVVLEIYSERLNYTYRKTISENAEGEICVHYEVTNHSNDEFPALWAGHCMINVCDGGKVIAPFSAGDRVEIMFDEKSEFGKKGDTRGLSEDMLLSSTSPERFNSFKYYFADPTSLGRLGYRYSDGTTFLLKYDPGKLPFVGLWINNGFFKNSFSVGLEPCNLGYDTVENAAKRGQHFSIAPKSTWSFDITFAVE